MLVAATRSPHVNTKHTVAMGVNNQPLEEICPIQSCKDLFVHGVTVIAPMTVVGPFMHGYIGDYRWVCVKHWKQSIEDASDDDFYTSEAWQLLLTVPSVPLVRRLERGMLAQTYSMIL